MNYRWLYFSLEKIFFVMKERAVLSLTLKLLSSMVAVAKRKSRLELLKAFILTADVVRLKPGFQWSQQ